MLLNGPLHSARATGKLADLLQFATVRGRHVVGRPRVPAQPRTIAQRATRIYMTWLTRAWSQATTEQQQTWLNYPDTPLLSPYHAYLAYNLNRFKHLPGQVYYSESHPNYPAIAYPATQATSPATSDYGLANGAVRSATWTTTISAANDDWMWTFHPATNEHPAPVYATLAAAIDSPGPGLHTFTIPNLPVGTYFLRAIQVSKTGKPAVQYRSRTVTVTA